MKLPEGFIGDLIKLLEIDSVKSEPQPGMPFGDGIGRALNCYLETAKGYGFETHNAEGYAGSVDYPGAPEGKTVGILMHLDVVPVSPARWTTPPFQPDIRDGKIYARGAADDKGPAVMLLHVLKRLKEDGYRPKNSLRIIVGGDEESGSACMEYYFRHYPMPDFGISPDADFPVINTENHIIRTVIDLPADGIFRQILDFKAGDRVNVVPDEAAAEFISGEKLTFSGRAAHSMEAYKGDNAIWKLCAAVYERGAAGAETAVTDATGKETINRETIGAETLGAGGQGETAKYLYEKLSRDCRGEGLGIAARRKSGELVCNFSVLKKSGERLRASLDIRCPAEIAPEEILNKIADGLPKGGTMTSDVKSGFTLPEDHPLVAALLSAYREVTGEDAAPLATNGGTYARELKTGVAFGPAFRGEKNNIHSHDEYLDLTAAETAFEIYYNALKKLGDLE